MPPKRKAAPPPSDAKYTPSQARKRVKYQDARTLAVQSSEAALSKTGELDVSAFVSARAYEIKALEDGLKNSKKALSTRAFQHVPRDMRRRTASHNVKKVPKRLKRRAEREMNEDNTPTVTARTREPSGKMRLRADVAKRVIARNKKSKEKKQAAKASSKEKDIGKMVDVTPALPRSKKNTLSDPPKPSSKFSKRQKSKTWLPTHMFHAKRAHMTPPNEPLWRFAVPLTSTEKSYRPTHRASGLRGAVAWDTSYMATIQLEGAQNSLENTLRELGCDGIDDAEAKRQKWINGKRIWEGWMYERDGGKHAIAPVTVIWCAPVDVTEVNIPPEGGNTPKKESKRSMFIRVHPSAFLQLWEEVLKVSKMQRPRVMVEDLRFDIGSIEVIGPGSTEALIGVLHPISQGPQSDTTPESVWKSLAGLANPAALPNGALLGFEVSDPRLRHPPRTIKIPTSDDDIIDTLVSWAPDKSQETPTIFSRNSRLLASRNLRSQKSINRHKAENPPGEPLTHNPDDPSIPAFLFVSRSANINEQATWAVLLPWKCIPPVWDSLMYYPLSSGGTSRFGGLQEAQQVCFEACKPWFPGDFPGTKAGWEWELRERQKRKAEWERKPPGRRVEYDSLDLGNGVKGEVGRGWTCDWERLLKGVLVPQEDTQKNLSEVETDFSPMNIDKTTLELRKEILGQSTQEIATATSTVPHEQNNEQLRPPRAPKTGITNQSNPQPTHLPTDLFSTLLKSLGSNFNAPSNKQLTLIQPSAITSIKITLPKGVPNPCARVYNLPSDPTLRARWFSLLEPTSTWKSSVQAQQASRPTKSQPQVNTVNTLETPRTDPIVLSDLASSLLNPPLIISTESIHPPCPREEDLIGFVTSGGFNLSMGRGTGIGCVSALKVLRGLRGDKRKGKKVCIVRNPGESVGRVAAWEAV